MKIPLEIHISEEESRLFVTVSISFLRLGIRPLKFMVDTGSPKTFIGNTDSQKLKLHTSGDAGKVFMGMQEIKLRGVRVGKIYLRGEENKIFTLETTSFDVADPVILSSGKMFPVPNILGLSFLITYGLGLHFIPSKNEAYLESVNEEKKETHPQDGPDNLSGNAVN